MTSSVPSSTRPGAYRVAARLVRSAFRRPAFGAFSLLLIVALLGSGCGRGAGIIPAELRKPIDRSVVEFPAGMRFERFITNLNSPTAIAFDTAKNALLVAESGINGDEPRILGFNYNDGATFRVYPQGKRLLGFREIPFQMYGPIGGMTVHEGVIYVSHRDRDGFGVISSVDYDGKGTTVVAGLPAQGDYGVTDVQFNAADGRLYFGVGTATNSGVVGLDNWDVGWVQRHPNLHDVPFVEYRARGFRFNSPNPHAGLFTGAEQAVTGPFQPFGISFRSKIAGDIKPNAAIYSVVPTGGIDRDLRIEAHGIRYPGGLAFHPEYNILYASNQGMEFRGTRPVKDDPNSILRIYRGRYLGWPDYTADLRSVTEEAFQPGEEVLRPTGYTENSALFDHPSGLGLPFDPTDRDNIVRAVMPSLSGAAKMTFLPDEGPMSEFRRQLVVALSGDRSPFANSGKKLKEPVGFKLVRVDVEGDSKVARDFIRNTAGVPRSMKKENNPDMLERPIDVKVGPDGYLYVLDLGKLEVKGGKNRVKSGTGQVFRLLPADAPTTGPANAEDASTDTK